VYEPDLPVRCRRCPSAAVGHGAVQASSDGLATRPVGQGGRPGAAPTVAATVAI
jgi:hypothetical protein